MLGRRGFRDGCGPRFKARAVLVPYPVSAVVPRAGELLGVHAANRTRPSVDPKRFQTTRACDTGLLLERRATGDLRLSIPPILSDRTGTLKDTLLWSQKCW